MYFDCILIVFGRIRLNFYFVVECSVGIPGATILMPVKMVMEDMVWYFKIVMTSS